MEQDEKQAAGRKFPALVAGAAGAACILAFGGMQARGQEGSLAVLGLSFGAVYTAQNPAEDESRLTTGLSFDLSRATDTQSFDLSADGRFVLDEDGFEFEQPRVALGYAIANRSTLLDANIVYSVRDVEGTEELIDPVTLTVIDLIDDDGTLESLGLDVGLETGRDAPFGTETRFGYTSRIYSGTSDPDLNDLESWQIGTTLRFEIDPRITLRTNASHRETHEDSLLQTNSRTTRFGFGAGFLIDPLWTASLDLSYSQFETEEDLPGGRFVSESDGLGFSLAVNRRFRDGVLGLSLARQETDDGLRDSLSVSRERVLRDGAELSWSLGVVSFANGDVAPIASAAYVKPTPRGRLSVSLQQSATVNADDDSVVSTSLGFSYGQDVDATSNWSLDGSLSSVDVLDGDAEDQARVAVGVSYNHALTREWDLSTALRHRITYEAGEQDNSASTLSLSLERSFSFRP